MQRNARSSFVKAFPEVGSIYTSFTRSNFELSELKLHTLPSHAPSSPRFAVCWLVAV